MNNLNKIICDTMHKFVSKHIDEVKDSYSNLGFKDSEDMINQIKNDIKTAIWALTELCYWGLKTNYVKMYFLYDETHWGMLDGGEQLVYTLKIASDHDVYFIIDSKTMLPIEVESYIRTIEITDWVKV